MTEIFKESTIRASFFVSAMCLFAFTVVTFIEAMRTKNVRARHILNLETAVSIVAGYVYFVLLDLMKNNEIQLKDVTKYRYLDWFITTPMLLLALLLFYNFHNPTNLSFIMYLIVILLNFTMLTAGYLGETGRISKNKGGIIGFIAFFAMAVFIWTYLLHNTAHNHHKILFMFFVFVWTMYGVAYYMNVHMKNIMYNILDIIAKVMFGIFMWLYYGQVVSI